jgi:hypothetical protein
VVVYLTFSPVQLEQARSVAPLSRMLGDQFLRQVIEKIMLSDHHFLDYSEN